MAESKSALSRDLYVNTYTAFSKDYALKDQINRASGSIMDNIAEGFGRQSSKEFINFLTIASGSALEVKSQLCRAQDRNYLPNARFEKLIEMLDEIGKMLSALISYLNKSDIRGFKFKDRST